MSVIEYIPLAIYLDYAAVVVRTAVRLHISRLISSKMQISVAYKYAAIFETAEWIIADSIAKLMHDFR